MKKTKVLVNKLLAEIEKAPVIQVACDKVGISRNTFYRWIKEDTELMEQVSEAMSLGTGLVSDVAISNVLEGLKRKDPMYTKYWLSHKHPDFRKPFVHKVDADDFLTHFRSVMEGIRKREIAQEIADETTKIEGARLEKAQKEVKEMMDRWKDTMEKSRHEEARKLFEEWKTDFLSEEDSPSQRPKKPKK